MHCPSDGDAVCIVLVMERCLLHCSSDGETASAADGG